MATQRHVRRRAGGVCEYCRLRDDDDPRPFHTEHVRPRQHHGDDRPDNLALACSTCNRRKGPNLAGIDPETGEPALLFDPRRQLWPDHFRWSGPLAVGLTPTGRATVDVLGMNALDQVALREGLVGEGRSLLG